MQLFPYLDDSFLFVVVLNYRCLLCLPKLICEISLLRKYDFQRFPVNVICHLHSDLPL